MKPATVQHTPKVVRCTDEDYGNQTTYEIRDGEKVIASVDERGNYDAMQFVQRAVNQYEALKAENDRLLNCHEDLLKELRRVTEDMNTLVDNDEHWNRAQMHEVIFAIQSNVANAIAKAEGL